MMRCGGLVEEDPEHSRESGTAHSEAAQQKALGCAVRHSETPRQKEPDTELEPSAERTNLGQRTGSGRELGLLREDSRGDKAANAGEKNERGQECEQDTIERHWRSLPAIAVQRTRGSAASNRADW